MSIHRRKEVDKAISKYKLGDLVFLLIATVGEEYLPTVKAALAVAATRGENYGKEDVLRILNEAKGNNHDCHPKKCH